MAHSSLENSQSIWGRSHQPSRIQRRRSQQERVPSRLCAVLRQLSQIPQLTQRHAEKTKAVRMDDYAPVSVVSAETERKRKKKTLVLTHLLHRRNAPILLDRRNRLHRIVIAHHCREPPIPQPPHRLHRPVQAADGAAHDLGHVLLARRLPDLGDARADQQHVAGPELDPLRGRHLLHLLDRDPVRVKRVVVLAVCLGPACKVDQDAAGHDAAPRVPLVDRGRVRRRADVVHRRPEAVVRRARRLVRPVHEAVPLAARLRVELELVVQPRAFGHAQLRERADLVHRLAPAGHRDVVERRQGPAGVCGGWVVSFSGAHLVRGGMGGRWGELNQCNDARFFSLPLLDGFN